MIKVTLKDGMVFYVNPEFDAVFHESGSLYGTYSEGSLMPGNFFLVTPKGGSSEISLGSVKSVSTA